MCRGRPRNGVNDRLALTKKKIPVTTKHQDCLLKLVKTKCTCGCCRTTEIKLKHFNIYWSPCYSRPGYEQTYKQLRVTGQLTCTRLLCNAMHAAMYCNRELHKTHAQNFRESNFCKRVI